MTGVVKLRCRDCPYGEEDFERRVGLWSYLKQSGEDAEIYTKYTIEEYSNETEQFVWCDKVGGKVYCYGRCTDWYKDNKQTQVVKCSSQVFKKKRKTKRERDQLHKQHLKWLERNIQSYPSPVIYENKLKVRNYYYIDNPKPYYKRCYRDKHGNGRYGYFKNYANRVVRRHNKEIYNGGSYKKLFDYWWTVD